MWTQDRLAATATDVFHGRKFIVVSSREPYTHDIKDGRIVCSSPAGGVNSALEPVVAAAGGTWVAQGTGSADHLTTSAQGTLPVPPGDPTFTLRRVWIPDALHKGFYDGFANQALWPLCHNVWQRPTYRASDWEAYRRVNQLYASAVLEEAAEDDAVVFVQDYQLALVPALLKRARPDLTVAHFWHIPWPAAELVRTCPFATDLLEGLLASDLIGFHLREHGDNFLAAAEQLASGRTDRLRRTFRHDQGITHVCESAISIDFASRDEAARSSEVEQAMAEWSARLGSATRIGIGIDRCDYTKGIPERLDAVEALLEQNPSLRGTFTFVQVAVPGRDRIPAYADLARQVEERAHAINNRWATAEWRPVILERRSLPQTEMMALHRLADLCVVSPLHDGMNLVAKEFVASRFDNDGVLILSRFAGAARELRSALQINPFCPTSLTEAIAAALTMPPSERRQRMAQARAVVASNNVYRWAGSLIEQMEAVMTRQKVANVA